MSQGKKDFVEISSVIDGWFQTKNYSQRRTDFDAFHNWDKIVGHDIAKNTEPVKIQKDVLVIKVRSSVWTQELQYMKPQILDKIRSSFPDTKIKDLMFRIGPVKK